MGQIGISIYPSRSRFEEDKAYLDLAKNTVLQEFLQVCWKYRGIRKK